MANTSADRPEVMSSRRAGPGAVDLRGQIYDHSDEAGGPVAADMLPFVLVNTQHPHVIQAVRVTVGQVPARVSGEPADCLPAQSQRAAARGNTQPVGGHTLQNPAGHPTGDQLSVGGSRSDRHAEDTHRAVVVTAGQLW